MRFEVPCILKFRVLRSSVRSPFLTTIIIYRISISKVSSLKSDYCIATIKRTHSSFCKQRCHHAKRYEIQKLAQQSTKLPLDISLIHTINSLLSFRPLMKSPFFPTLIRTSALTSVVICCSCSPPSSGAS